MSKKTQLIILGVLLVLLAVVAYFSFFRSAGAPQAVFSATESYPPIGVENPELRLWQLEKARKTQPATTHRNIFSATPPPPPVDQSLITQPPPVPVQPAEQQPVLPVKFFGYGSVPASGQRRAFFTNGEDVYIVAEGEMLLGQFRILHIGNTTLDFEVIGSGRRGSVVLEEQGPSA